jgi:hypothetical protein
MYSMRMKMQKVNHVRGLLKEIEYPVNKDEMITHAERSGADAYALIILCQLPRETYHSSAQVIKAFRSR